MRLSSRWLASGLVAFGLAALLGCQESNEESAKITSAPPPAGAKPPPKTQAEFFQQSQGTSNLKSQGYPGAPK